MRIIPSAYVFCIECVNKLNPSVIADAFVVATGVRRATLVVTRVVPQLKGSPRAELESTHGEILHEEDGATAANQEGQNKSLVHCCRQTLSIWAAAK